MIPDNEFRVDQLRRNDDPLFCIYIWVISCYISNLRVLYK